MTRITYVLLLGLVMALGGVADGSAGTDPAAACGEETVRIEGPAGTIAGILTRPVGEGPFPAVILVGAGGMDREGDMMGLKVWQRLARALAEAGIASWRYDTRGVGETAGTLYQATIVETAGDALAGVDYLQKQPGINPERIGLCGLSEGGWIAELAAARSPEVAFLVVISTPSLPVTDFELAMIESQGQLNGATESEIRVQQDLQRKLHTAVRQGADPAVLRPIMKRQLELHMAKQPPEIRKMYADTDAVVDAQLPRLSGPYYRHLVDYDPAATQGRIRCPVLALYGGLDKKVDGATDRLRRQAALGRGGNPRFTARIFPAGNHIMVAAETGTTAEAIRLAQEQAPFVAGFSATLSGWIYGVTTTRGSGGW